jgi:hypothetical protein
MLVVEAAAVDEATAIGAEVQVAESEAEKAVEGRERRCSSEGADGEAHRRHFFFKAAGFDFHSF